MPAAIDFVPNEQATEEASPSKIDFQPIDFQPSEPEAKPLEPAASDTTLGFQPSQTPSRITLDNRGDMRRPSTTEGGGRAPVASASETFAEPVEEITNPRITTPKFKVQKNDPALMTIGKEAVNIASSIPEFLSSDLGIGGMVSGAVAPVATATAFTADMLHSLGQQIKSAYKNWDSMGRNEKVAAVTDMVGTGGMAALAAHGGYRAAFPAKPTPKITVDDRGDTAAGITKQFEDARQPPAPPPGDVKLTPTVTTDQMGAASVAPAVEPAAKVGELEHPVEAAFKDKNGKVWTGTAHVSVDMPPELRDDAEMGFVTSKGRFVGYDHGLALGQKHYDALEKAGIDPNTGQPKEPSVEPAAAKFQTQAIEQAAPILPKAAEAAAEVIGVKVPEKPASSTFNPEKFSLQNGRAQIEVGEPYEVGGRPQQWFMANGDKIPGFEAFAEKYPAAAEEIRKRNATPEPAAPAEPTKTVVPEKPAVKEPWQMTKAEWNGHLARGTWADFEDAPLAEANRAEHRSMAAQEDAEASRSKLGPLESIRKVMADRSGALKRNQERRDADKLIEQRRLESRKASRRAARMADHEAFIIRAQERGETIPPEVLADYPDLKPKPAPITEQVEKSVEAAPVVTPTKATDKAGVEIENTITSEGSTTAKGKKSQLVESIEQAIEQAPSEEKFPGLQIARAEDAKDKSRGRVASRVAGVLEDAGKRGEIKKVTIDIPGDGKFTVWNTKENLMELRDRAKRISTRANDPTKIKKRGSSDEDKAWVAEQLDAAKAQAEKEHPTLPGTEEEQGQSQVKSDPFERARAGDESAFDDLDAQFREVYPEEIDFGRGRTDPNTVHTPQAFASLFDRAFAARDFDTILNAIKATSDVSIWKPYLRDIFKRQAKDPVAAEKAEWMRHVFAGTRPANAIPRPPPRPAAPRGQPPPVTSPPRPKAGTPPPPKPPPGPTVPPTPPPTRIPVDPIPGGGGKSPFRIIEDFSKAIGKAIRVLRMKKNGLGVYRPGSTLTAERFAGDLDTAAHELAGHWTDDKYGIGKPWVAGRVRSPYDTELAKFWPFGSVTPRSSLRYRRAEGIAEYIRAYVVNPKQAKLDAPLFSAYFERTLTPEALKAIQDFSEDVRRWAGENPTIRAGLNIRMEVPTLTERLWNALKGKGFGFETSPIDKLRLWFDDPYHYAVKADKAIQQLRGGAPRLPSQEFELTARLLATHDSRMSDQFENGLVPLRPGQIRNAKGELEVQRTIDPVTRQPMTMKWLLGAFDTTGGKDRFNQDMRDASAYMVSQRTVEKAKQLGREENVSGIGAGIMSDVQAAKELLADVAKDPAKEARLKEAARRYRLWADQNIQMLVDAGRITPGQSRAIRDSNQQYVDMHRLSEEFDVANYAQRGGGIGTVKDVVKRFKGSSLELDNVYSNLLEQTDSIQKEAHRNVVMNNFTDGLRNVRALHGPDLKDFDQFGRQVTSADKNTITIYKNGKAEHWQFAPPIFESLKGLGELQTNALFTIAMMPSKFARYMITRGPSFMIRNPLRDTTERSVNSRSGSKPWDIFQGYSKAELSRYETFGGGQFGNYIVDQHVWNREIKKVMRELVKDPTNILLSPLKLKHAWEELGEKSEKIGRIAEFRRAFETGKKKIAAEHPGLTPEELDYNAALYAAGEARGLLDFAKAGTVMRYVNQAIPFSNASMRGLGKSIQGMRDNPGRYAMNWGLYVLAPTIAVMMWNRRDPETWKEYQQLPAYRRDFFWNLKVGDRWLMIPKPHLLGVLAGGVERIVNGIMGTPHAMSGYGSGIGNAFPVSNIAEASGPLKTFLELNMNRDTFRDRDIVPAWEKDLKLELRKGTKHASGAAQGIANALNTAGLGIDSRSVDHVLRSTGGWGTIATGATTRNRDIGDTAIQATGLFTESPGPNAQDVQWVLDWARQNGKLQDARVKALTDLRKSYFEAKTSEARARISKRLRDTGSSLRNSIEKSKK